MLQKKRFGDDCAGTAGSHGPDRRDDQMNYQDEPIPHTANDDRAGRTLQGYEPGYARDRLERDRELPLCSESEEGV
jgi:hypothetical protein